MMYLFVVGHCIVLDLWHVALNKKITKDLTPLRKKIQFDLSNNQIGKI